MSIIGNAIGVGGFSVSFVGLYMTDDDGHIVYDDDGNPISIS